MNRTILIVVLVLTGVNAAAGAAWLGYAAGKHAAQADAKRQVKAARDDAARQRNQEREQAAKELGSQSESSGRIVNCATSQYRDALSNWAQRYYKWQYSPGLFDSNPGDAPNPAASVLQCRDLESRGRLDSNGTPIDV